MVEPLIKIGHIIMPMASIKYLYKMSMHDTRIYIRCTDGSGLEGTFENQNKREEWYNKFINKFVTKI